MHKNINNIPFENIFYWLEKDLKALWRYQSVFFFQNKLQCVFQLSYWSFSESWNVHQLVIFLSDIHLSSLFLILVLLITGNLFTRNNIK